MLGHDPEQRSRGAARAGGHRPAVDGDVPPHHPARGAGPLRPLLSAPARRRGGHRDHRPAGEGRRLRADAVGRPAAPARPRARAHRRPRADLPRRATTGFDPAARRNAWEVIRSLQELGKTILLTTHYLDEAQARCDRVAIVKEGRILAEGPPGGWARRRRAIGWRGATRAASCRRARSMTRRRCCIRYERRAGPGRGAPRPLGHAAVARGRLSRAHRRGPREVVQRLAPGQRGARHLVQQRRRVIDLARLELAVLVAPRHR